MFDADGTATESSSIRLSRGSRVLVMLRALPWHRLAALATVVLFGLALWVLHRELANVRLRDISAEFRVIPLFDVLSAIGLTVTSYLALTGYDWLALRQIGRPLPYRQVAMIAFVATAVGHNVGAAMLSGGAVRLRLYGALGLGGGDVARVVGLVSLTFGVGASVLGGVVLLAEPEAAGHVMHVAPAVAILLGVMALLPFVAYLGWSLFSRTRAGPFGMALPSASTIVAQFAFAAIDLCAAAGVLYVLLPAATPVSYAQFLPIYILALLAGIVSHVPGGVGVFESVLLLAMPGVPGAELLGAALAYRLVYYLLPLGVSALAIGGVLAIERRQSIDRTATVIGQLALRAAPALLASFALVTGVLLMLSGSTPALRERLAILANALPLSVLEFSHLLASLAGLGLVIVAHGLWQRVRSAWLIALILLSVAIVASLVKGLDYEEATVCAFVLVSLLSSRRAFYRDDSLARLRPTWPWLALVAGALAGSLWLGYFAYRHVDASQFGWLHFALHGDAPRFLRAALATVVAATAWTFWKLLQPVAPAPELPDESGLALIAPIVFASAASDAALALMGDKRILLDAPAGAFVMYQVRARNWVAMGGPVGPASSREALAWRFRELAHDHGGRASFYQVDAESLPLYLDLGLAPYKLGEEAVVDLADFDLESSRHRGLRQAFHRCERAGAGFEVIEPAAVAQVLPRLREVSDQWLLQKSTREKGFSVGAFDAAYLARFPCAVVRVGGVIVAFANLWPGDGSTELSVDLMRFDDKGAPGGVMDYLLSSALLWGKARGYQRFNLGMTPLAGLESHRLAPLWHRAGNLVYRHGEFFYNFEGLRRYKEKFAPQWQPRYIAAAHGIALPALMLDVAALIAGGVGGIVRR